MWIGKNLSKYFSPWEGKSYSPPLLLLLTTKATTTKAHKSNCNQAKKIPSFFLHLPRGYQDISQNLLFSTFCYQDFCLLLFLFHLESSSSLCFCKMHMLFQPPVTGNVLSSAMVNSPPFSRQKDINQLLLSLCPKADEILKTPLGIREIYREIQAYESFLFT